ncbi:hypothetical protein LO772_20750 [Yinghuangia sp. ASG 101]|uniref:SCO3933 family regulatory protein n=1 Tax=Yinghuangia sp. ASG 101 TaxID=2896848 RepID=UPI001E47DE56|nr:hypothetical protein [Yinghuangia sp. ASG 101]UGQ09364.1 hypothetical protein LO772_20750 [Yinghuangia sp. ASG 101]
MQSIPVDVSRLGTLRCVVEPEVRTNFETGEIKRGRDGIAMWTVGVSVRQADSRRASVIEISVPGEPSGIEEGSPVAVVGLVAVPWSQGGRNGIAFRAESIASASASAVAPKSGGKSGGVG